MQKPPRFALRFLEWFCPSALYEGIEGDLIECFELDAKVHGPASAKRRFVWNVFRFFRSGIFLRNKFQFTLNFQVMFGNYVKVASRNIGKRKMHSFINAFGLSIGLAFCILIYLFIQNEQSFDQFHENKSKICLLYGVNYTGDVVRNNDEPLFQKTYFMQMGLAVALKTELSQVEYATHYCKSQKILAHDENIFKDEVIYVDADFFKMFSFNLISGNRSKLFEKDDELVLTLDMANKYFGKTDILNEVLMIEGKPHTVTGVMENPPANSSVQFLILLPVQGWRNYTDNRFNTWFNQSYPTFIQLRDNADETALNAGIDKIRDKYIGSAMKEEQAKSNVPDSLPIYDIEFLKLENVHLQKDLGFDKASDPQYAWILGGIAILILVIACINYILLSLTASIKRRTEVGIRKAIGAYRKQLIVQFSMESIMLSVISAILSVGLVALFLPAFNRFTGKAIAWQGLNLVPVLLLVLGCSVIVGLVAGAYPSLHLSRFRPIQVLRGSAVKLSANFSKPLLVIQLALSSFLIICSVIMYRQMEFITTKDLGYNQHQLLVIPTQARRSDGGGFIDRFRQKVSTNPDVISLTAASYSFAGSSLMRVGYDAEDKQHMEAYMLSVDPYYLKTIGVNVIQGRDFTSTDAMDTSHLIIVNEAFVHNAQINNPIDHYVAGLDSRIIGVVKDFHFTSLEKEIDPMFLAIESDNNRLSDMLIRI